MSGNSRWGTDEDWAAEVGKEGSNPNPNPTPNPTPNPNPIPNPNPNPNQGKDFDAPCRTNKIPREVPAIP